MRFAMLLSLFGAATAFAADPNPADIIQKFAAKEAEFRKARESYTYKQSVKLEELDSSGLTVSRVGEISLAPVP